MSVWTTRGLDRVRHYVVLRHPLKGVNNIINGVKFRQGYAVVEKDSKTYHHLKKIPLLHKAEAFPLTHLRKLSFITRTSDVKMVFGSDVYRAFLQAEQSQVEDIKKSELEVKVANEAAEQAKRKEELQKLRDTQDRMKGVADNVKTEMKEIIEDSQESKKISDNSHEISFNIKKCCFLKTDGNLCKVDALDHSPSKYCSLHMLEDDKLEGLGIKVPNLMTKTEKKKVRKLVHKKLKELKAKGKF